MAVRLAARQLRALEARARREGVGLSEALRRCVDEWAATSGVGAAKAAPRARPPTAKERATFDPAFDALGIDRKPRGRRRRAGA